MVLANAQPCLWCWSQLVFYIIIFSFGDADFFKILAIFSGTQQNFWGLRYKIHRYEKSAYVSQSIELKGAYSDGFWSFWSHILSPKISQKCLSATVTYVELRIYYIQWHTPWMGNSGIVPPINWSFKPPNHQPNLIWPRMCYHTERQNIPNPNSTYSADTSEYQK